jgi:hypothetical protein
MPFEIIGLDSVSREEREENCSGVDGWGWKNIKGGVRKGWKGVAKGATSTWKGTKALATGKAFKHKSKPAEIKKINEEAINQAMSNLGLSGRTSLTKQEWVSVEDYIVSRLGPQKSWMKANNRHIVGIQMKKMGIVMSA